MYLPNKFSIGEYVAPVKNEESLNYFLGKYKRYIEDKTFDEFLSGPFEVLMFRNETDNEIHYLIQYNGINTISVPERFLKFAY